jgi:hypothetical protein
MLTKSFGQLLAAQVLKQLNGILNFLELFAGKSPAAKCGLLQRLYRFHCDP